jgi:hypothetical protein
MISKKVIIVLGIATLGLLVWLITWYSRTVPFSIGIDPSSQVKTGLVATTSKDSHKKSRSLPYSTRVRPGNYSVTAWGNGSAPVSVSYSVERGKDNKLLLYFRPVSGDDFIKLYQGDPSKKVPYLELFPHETIDYLISATHNNESITAITISVKHRFTTPKDGKSYIEERDIVATAAKNWLKERGVPGSIPVTIIDFTTNN